MDIGTRAARDQIASERLVAAAHTLAERAGITFEPATLTRRDPDPAVKALFQREALADLLDALVTARFAAETAEADTAEVAEEAADPAVKVSARKTLKAAK